MVQIKLVDQLIILNLSTEGIAVTLVFVDSTRGWLVTDSGLQSEAPQSNSFVAASGGTEVTCGDFKTHTFTGPGTFAVSSLSGTASRFNNVADYLVIAGGGGSTMIQEWWWSWSWRIIETFASSTGILTHL